MSNPSIRIEGLGKRYRLGETHEYTLSEQVIRMARRMVGGASVDLRRPSEDFWALQDVSFQVNEGEAVGIIGGNGAGKSTLLKILSRITPPTTGRALVRGRLSSLLEVGTGFHPELTGRENVFLNGAILGMRKTEVVRKFDEIVAFAGVEQFIDTPVKRYSSGMYVRLAFAVAAHLEPDVLIIDEVLAVGDAEFQRRCLGKMGDVARAGRTVLFVSHNMAAIQKLCTRAVWLQDGRLRLDGGSTEVVDAYLSQELQDRGDVQHQAGVLFEKDGAAPSEGTETLRVEMLDERGTPVTQCSTWDALTFRIVFRCVEPYTSFSVALSIFTPDGQRLILTSSAPDHDVQFGVSAGLYRIDCRFSSLPLTAGKYRLGINLAIPGVRSVWKHDALCSLNVLPRDVFKSGRFPTAPRYLVVTPSQWQIPVEETA